MHTLGKTANVYITTRDRRSHEMTKVDPTVHLGAATLRLSTHPRLARDDYIASQFNFCWTNTMGLEKNKWVLGG